MFFVRVAGAVVLHLMAGLMLSRASTPVIIFFSTPSLFGHGKFAAMTGGYVRLHT